MKVLVTGGAGYIGSHTTLALLEAGYEVVVIDNFSNSFPESLNRVGKLAGKKPIVMEGDLNDERLLKSIFTEHAGIEAVIHFAALKAVGESTEYPLNYYHNNVSCSICLLQAMEKAGVHQLVFSSSCTVYGEPERVPLDEKHPVGGVSSPYGRTKFQMEEIIRDHASANPNFKAGVLRYFNPVGAHSSGEIGEDPNGIPDNLVPFVCQVATGQRKKLRVFGSDYPTRDGTAVRDYLHVVDLADAHLKALEALNRRDSGFICNLGTGKGSSVLEVITAFEKATGKKIPYEIVGRRTGDVTEAWADPTYAEKLLGWKTVRSLEEMLADAWHWQSKNPNGYRSANNNP
jgi:UDP-glucose 4-epimerase